MCRSLGIPARPVFGAHVVSWDSSLQWHVWPEFYIQGTGWVPCDPTDADLWDRREQDFAALPNTRLALSRNVNVVMRPTPPDWAIAFNDGSDRSNFLQTVWWWWRRTGPGPTLSLQHTAYHEVVE